jgi:hypothetical protein
VFLASCVLQRSGDGDSPGIMPGTVHRPLELALLVVGKRIEQ